MAANEDLRKLMEKVISQTEKVKETAEKQLIKSCEIIQAEKDDYVQQLQAVKAQQQSVGKPVRKMSSEQYSLAGRIAFFERKIRQLDTQLMHTRADYNARIRSAEGLIRLQKSRMKQLDRMPVNGNTLRAEIENWDQKTRSVAGVLEDRSCCPSQDDSSVKSGSDPDRNARRRLRLTTNYRPPSKDGVKRRSLYPEYLSQNSKFSAFLRKHDGKPPPLPANLGYEAPDKNSIGSRTSHRSLYSAYAHRGPRKGILRKRASVPLTSSLDLDLHDAAMSESDVGNFGEGGSLGQNQRYVLSRTLSLTSAPPLDFFCLVEPTTIDAVATGESSVSPTGRDMRRAIRQRAERRRRENESPCSSFSSRDNMQPVSEDRVPLATLDLFNVSSQPMDLAEKIDLWSARDDTGKLAAEIDAIKKEQAEFLYDDTFESELSDGGPGKSIKAKSLAASVPESCITEVESKDSEFEIMRLTEQLDAEISGDSRSVANHVENPSATEQGMTDVLNTTDLRHADSLSEAESGGTRIITNVVQRSSPSFPAILVSQAYNPAYLMRLPERDGVHGPSQVVPPGREAVKVDGETPDSGIASASSFGRIYESPALQRTKLQSSGADGSVHCTATENSSGYSESIYDEYRRCIDEKSRPLLDLEKKLRRSLEEIDGESGLQTTSRTVTEDLTDDVQVTPRVGLRDDESGVYVTGNHSNSPNVSNSYSHDDSHSDSGGTNSLTRLEPQVHHGTEDRMFFEAKDTTTITRDGVMISRSELSCGTYVEHQQKRKRAHSVSGGIMPRDVSSIDISIKFRSQENLRSDLMPGSLRETETTAQHAFLGHGSRKPLTAGAQSGWNPAKARTEPVFLLGPSSHRAVSAIALAVHELRHMDPTADYFSCRSHIVVNLMPDERVTEPPLTKYGQVDDMPHYAAKFAVVIDSRDSQSEEEVFEERIITETEQGDEIVVSRKDYLASRAKNKRGSNSEEHSDSSKSVELTKGEKVIEPPCELVYFPPLYSDGNDYTRLAHSTNSTSSDVRPNSQNGSVHDTLSTWKFNSESPAEPQKAGPLYQIGTSEKSQAKPKQQTAGAGKKEDILSVSYVNGVPYISLDDRSLKSGDSSDPRSAAGYRKWSSADDVSSEATEPSESILLAKSLPTIFTDSSNDAAVLGLCKTVAETIREAKEHIYDTSGHRWFAVDDDGSDVDSLDSLPTHNGSTSALVYSTVDRTLYDGLFADNNSGTTGADSGIHVAEVHAREEEREMGGSMSDMSLHDDKLRVAQSRPSDLPIRSRAWGSRASLASMKQPDFNPIGHSHFDDENADSKKSVSWSDLRGRPLEVGPSSLGNWDDSPKPIIKNRSSSADRGMPGGSRDDKGFTVEYASPSVPHASHQQSLIQDEKSLQDILFGSAGAEVGGSTLTSAVTVDRKLLLRLLVSPESEFFAAQQRPNLHISTDIAPHHSIQEHDSQPSLSNGLDAASSPIADDVTKDAYHYLSHSSAEASSAALQSSSLIQVDYVSDGKIDSYERSIDNKIIRDKMICDEIPPEPSTVEGTSADASRTSEGTLQKYRRLIGDLEVLTIERANILDSLGSDPAGVIDMSSTTKKYLSEYRSKLIQIKAELDAKISAVNDELNKLDLPPEMQKDIDKQRERKLWSSDEMTSVSRAPSGGNDAVNAFESTSANYRSSPPSESGMSASYSGHRSTAGHSTEHRDRLIQLRKCLVTTCRDLAESYADSVLTRYSRRLSSEKDEAEGTSRSSRTPEPYLSPGELLDEFRRARILSRAEIGNAFRDLDRVRRKLTVSYETELPAAQDWEMGFRERLYGTQSSRERLTLDENIDREIASLARHYSTVKREYEPRGSGSDWRNYRTENVRLKREERKRQGTYFY